VIDFVAGSEPRRPTQVGTLRVGICFARKEGDAPAGVGSYGDALPNAGIHPSPMTGHPAHSPPYGHSGGRLATVTSSPRLAAGRREGPGGHGMDGGDAGGPAHHPAVSIKGVGHESSERRWRRPSKHGRPTPDPSAPPTPSPARGDRRREPPPYCRSFALARAAVASAVMPNSL
jgi:hypothetical protein